MENLGGAELVIIVLFAFLGIFLQILIIKYGVFQGLVKFEEYQKSRELRRRKKEESEK